MHVSLLTGLGLLAAVLPPTDDSGPRPLDLRANEFTRSSQDSAALGSDARGRATLVWQSRRQQGGTYGIYARRYDTDGAALSDEVQVNATTHGMQMQPAIDVAADGTSWFAWRSFGADGDLGAIVARRFAPDLGSATGEVLVNARAEGHQSEPRIAALPCGGALVVWLTPTDVAGEIAVRARRLGPDGAPAGAPFRVDAGAGAEHRTPALATAPDGRALVAFARVDAAGVPAGVFVRRLDESGAPLGDEVRLDGEAGAPGIEPVVALDAAGRALAGWFESTGGDYAIRVRGLEWTEDALVASPTRTLEVSGEGYTSGLDVALDGAGAGLVSWSRFADGPKGEAGLFARRVDVDGAPRGTAFRATAAADGPQALAAATGTRRTWLGADGRMAFAWSGDADLGDGSGAHLTLHAPEGLAFAPAPDTVVAAGETFQDLAEGARPHDPPVFDPRDVERDREDDVNVLAGGAIDFLGFANTGWTPPDPEMGVGPDHIVAMVNGGIAWYLKDGTQQFQQDINGNGGFWGSVGASTFVFDPEVVWDTHDQRFVAFASDANNGFLLAVSDDADPNGNWFKYRIDTTSIFGTDFIDSGNLAVDDEVITITGDIFGPDRLTMLFIDKTSAYSGSPLVFQSSVINGRQSMGTCTNYDAGAQPLYMMWAEEFTTSTSLRVYAVTNRLTSPSTQFTTVTVPSYSHPADPPQQGTSSRPELFEARFWSAMVRDGQLWCTHHQGSGRARVRWYQFDLMGWPTSGNVPSLVQSGEVDLGAGLWTFFGSIWADAQQNMALTFARSASNEFISMQMAYREAGDPLGTTRPPIEIRPSTSPETSGRWGDYSATNDDPALPGSFWGHHEYRESGIWRTRIARVDLCGGGTTNYCVTSPNSVGSGALISSTGSTSIGANDFGLLVQDCPPNQFGFFFYGPNQTQTASGDGFVCVSGSLFRLLPPVKTDGFGIASRAVDYGNLPVGGEILAGSTWQFQFGYRDPQFGNFGFNFSDALEAVFCD